MNEIIISGQVAGTVAIGGVCFLAGFIVSWFDHKKQMKFAKSETLKSHRRGASRTQRASHRTIRRRARKSSKKYEAIYRIAGGTVSCLVKGPQDRATIESTQSLVVYQFTTNRDSESHA